jgi:RNA polymerase sigma factor (sigma-70 family)
MLTRTAAASKGYPCDRRSDDRTLVAAVRDGDEHGFELLFERYWAPVGAYVAAMVRDHGHSEEVTQEVFISALRSLRSSRRPIAFKPWIYEIARNACIDRHRRIRRGDELAAGADVYDECDPTRLVGARPEPSDEVEIRARFDELCRTLMDLPALDRKLLVMREFEGRPYSEIVERSGLSAAAVESALFRARRRLIDRCGPTARPAMSGDEDAPPAPESLDGKRSPGGVRHLRDDRRVPAARRVGSAP